MADVKRNLITMMAACERGGFKRTKAYELINKGKIIAYKIGTKTGSAPTRCHGFSRAVEGGIQGDLVPRRETIGVWYSAK
jgi:hypothetical protein